jgi:hypothetical protein
VHAQQPSRWNSARLIAFQQQEVIMFRSGCIFFAVALCAPLAEAAPANVTRTVVQHRAVFDLVSVKTNVRQVCAGQEPLAVEFKRTAGDVAAAVFTGLWYTPVHLRVTCSPP